MKRNSAFLFILILFVSFFIGFSEVKAVETSNNYQVTFLADQSDEVCTGLLGENLKKDLEQILKIMRVAGPIIVVILSSVEYITALTSKDDDALKKTTQKLVTRLVLIIVLFFLPVLLNLLLSFIDSKYTTCIN